MKTCYNDRDDRYLDTPKSSLIPSGRQETEKEMSMKFDDKQSGVQSGTSGAIGGTDDQDIVSVTDSASRRRFIRSGSGFLLGAGLLASGVVAADCDNGQGGRQRTGCSDADSGTNGDPRGCGICKEPENVPSSYSPEEVHRTINVAKVRG